MSTGRRPTNVPDSRTLGMGAYYLPFLKASRRYARERPTATQRVLSTTAITYGSPAWR